MFKSIETIRVMASLCDVSLANDFVYEPEIPNDYWDRMYPEVAATASLINYLQPWFSPALNAIEAEFNQLYYEDERKELISQLNDISENREPSADDELNIKTDCPYFYALGILLSKVAHHVDAKIFSWAAVNTWDDSQVMHELANPDFLTDLSDDGSHESLKLSSLIAHMIEMFSAMWYQSKTMTPDNKIFPIWVESMTALHEFRLACRKINPEFF